MSEGRLFVVATPIGNLDDLSPRAREVLASADVVASEDTRHTGRLLEHLSVSTPQVSYHEHNERSRTPELVSRLQAGETIALVTDAGTPVVSDPGYRLVRAAAAAGVPVEAVPGPSAVLAALSVSGLAPQPFTFVGFLPKKGGARTRTLELIESSAHTVVFFESPQRIVKTLEALADLLGDRQLAVCRELTKMHEETVRGSAAELAGILGQRGGLKGEVTVVVEGAPTPVEIPDVESLRAEGKSLSQIAKIVARATGRPKSEVYAELVERFDESG